jgi:hypothetical protein
LGFWGFGVLGFSGGYYAEYDYFQKSNKPKPIKSDDWNRV